MLILRGETVVLTKEFERLKVGETYEVANITDDSIVLREKRSKVAVGVIPIKDFEEHFVKPEEMKSWTPWIPFADSDGNTAFYRTNMRKVEVRWNGYKSAAYCSKYDDFNLFFGLTLAYRRCEIKWLLDQKTKGEELLRFVEGELADNTNLIKRMIASLEEKVTK